MRNSTLKKVLREIRPYRIWIWLSLLLSAISVGASLYVPVLIGDAIDAIESGVPAALSGPFYEILTRLLVAVMIAAFCQWVASIIHNRTVYHITSSLRDRVFLHIQHLPLAYLDRHSSGDLVSRMIADIDQFSDGLLMSFSQLFTGILTVLGTLVFMLTVHVWIALVVILMTPVSVVVAHYISKKSYDYFEAQAKSRGEETSFINEIIAGEKTVKAYGYERQTVERFDGLNETLRRHSLKAVFYSSLVNPTTRFINALVYAFVGVFGAFFVIRTGGAFSIGRLTCFLTYANQHTKPYADITGVITELQNAFASAERVFTLIEEKAEEADAVPETAEMSRPTEGLVEFDRVSFSYIPERPLIRDFELKAEPGGHIAIVGKTGCGKTTLINLLMRFYEVDSGEIRIDGVPIREMTRETLRSKFGMVLQESWIRSGTVWDNLKLGKPDATEEEIVAASKKTHAHRFIRRLKDGYDTVLSEGGNELSEGQKQLICITRVMLAKPPMLILDEATSSIDTRTEKLIQDAFSVLMEGRTSFIVAHRLSTIREADRILVMADGRIVEQGRHKDLLKLGGAYAAIYESQFKGIMV